jgi:hypothetical protein
MALVEPAYASLSVECAYAPLLVGFGRLERAVTRRSTLVGARPPEDTCLIEREKVRGVDPDQWTQWARIQLG